VARKIEVQVVGDADSLHRALSKASDSTSRFGRIAGTVGKAGMLAIGAASVGAAIGIKKLIDAGSDMNETVNKSNVIFGKSAKSVQEWSTTMAEAGGISEQAALDAASMFGTFGKAAGVGQKQLDKWSESLVQASSDLASFHNVDPTQALEDIRSGLAGEVEPLRKYGILLNDATLRQQALKMGLVSTTKDALSPQNKMLAAHALILKDLGPATGDFARTSEGLANQQRILKAELQNVVTELGTALLPIVVAVAKVAIPALIGTIHGLSRAFKGAIEWVNKIADHFGVLGGKSATAGGKIHAAFAAVVGFFQSNVMPIVNRLRGVFADAMAAIAKVVQRNGDAIHRIMSRVGEALKAVAKVAIPILRVAFVKVLPQAIDGAIRAIDDISAAIATLVNWLNTAVHAIEDLKNKLDFLGGANQGLLGKLGINIDPSKGLFNQVSIPGLPSGNNVAGARFTIEVPVMVDGREIGRAVVNQDKISRRQSGRSLFA
jgi:hypothetical protein